jgi:hypothetical protein
MKTNGGVEIYLHAFLTSTLDGSEGSASRPGRFTPKERASGTHWRGDLVGPRASLDTLAKKKIPASAGNRAQVVQPVAQWLSYPGSLV